ncbi:MAG TPA: translational GTPase TypA, partial [Pseudoalteromonas sp.]|nr:translational GTPase TypA [Pseudoalteromonas sp.]
EQLDFKVIYASAINGWATMDLDEPSDNMEPMFQMIVDEVSPPDADPEGAFQMQISQLDYNSYIGVIGVGRIKRGTVRPNQQVTIVSADGTKRNGKVGQVMSYLGLERHEAESAGAGDIIAITGLGELKISDTICDVNTVEALPPLSVDEPTVTMTFSVNTSPFAGKEGKFVTSRNILERLQAELVHNVALRVEETDNPDSFRVSGRGELHLGILIENMRREGYELAVSRPQVILREVDGQKEEPYETLTIDCQEEHQGSIMEQIGLRKGELTDMSPDGKGRVRMDFMIPSRGLIGFQTEFMTLTSGSGLLYHTFDHYGPHKGGTIGARKNGVMIANATGKALTNALFNLQDRGKLFIGHGVEVYEGMVIGIHSRDNDLTVNALKGKQLTNVRASGTDEAQTLTPPLNYTLEQAIEFIDDDELVEVTPQSIRIRKRHLTESERKRASRQAKD